MTTKHDDSRAFNMLWRDLDRAFSMPVFTKCEVTLLQVARELSYTSSVMDGTRRAKPFRFHISKIAERRHISREELQRALRNLIQDNVLLGTSERLKINKNYREWTGRHELYRSQVLECESAINDAVTDCGEILPFTPEPGFRPSERAVRRRDDDALGVTESSQDPEDDDCEPTLTTTPMRDASQPSEGCLTKPHSPLASPLVGREQSTKNPPPPPSDTPTPTTTNPTTDNEPFHPPGPIDQAAEVIPAERRVDLHEREASPAEDPDAQEQLITATIAKARKILTEYRCNVPFDRGEDEFVYQRIRDWIVSDYTQRQILDALIAAKSARPGGMVRYAGKILANERRARELAKQEQPIQSSSPQGFHRSLEPAEKPLPKLVSTGDSPFHRKNARIVAEREAKREAMRQQGREILAAMAASAGQG